MANQSAPAKDLSKFRTQLKAQQRELEYAVMTIAEQGRDSDAEATQDVADQAVSSYQKEILFTRGSNDHEQLQLVRQALIRLDQGNFGTCINCEQKIGQKRLEALPWTPYCLDCQEKLEQGELEVLEQHRRAS